LTTCGPQKKRSGIQVPIRAFKGRNASGDIRPGIERESRCSWWGGKGGAGENPPKKGGKGGGIAQHLEVSLGLKKQTGGVKGDRELPLDIKSVLRERKKRN